MTKEQLKMRFGDEVADIVDLLTRKDGERYTAYIQRLSHNPIAREVKIADLIDNSNLTRLSHVAIGDAVRQYRYNHALQILLRSANNDL